MAGSKYGIRKSDFMREYQEEIVQKTYNLFFVLYMAKLILFLLFI